jgi:hypothetical protein
VVQIDWILEAGLVISTRTDSSVIEEELARIAEWIARALTGKVVIDRADPLITAREV